MTPSGIHPSARYICRRYAARGKPKAMHCPSGEQPCLSQIRKAEKTKAPYGRNQHKRYNKTSRFLSAVLFCCYVLSGFVRRLADFQIIQIVSERLTAPPSTAGIRIFATVIVFRHAASSHNQRLENDQFQPLNLRFCNSIPQVFRFVNTQRDFCE